MAAEAVAERPPLSATVEADVCIVGGGYTGLWAAIELLEADPQLRVVLLERESCGFGASGRNGGWVTGWFDELDALVERFGPEQGLRLAERSSAAIARIGGFAAEHGIECDFRQRGARWTAMAPAQTAAFGGAREAVAASGRPEMLEELDAEEVRRRTGSPLPLAAVRHTDAAAVQPAKLVRGLRRAAMEMGARVFEGTPMVGLELGQPVRVEAPAGAVRAERVILATGVYSGGFRALRRAFVPVGSHLVATEPIPERLGGLPWAEGELFGDARLMVHYAQVSAGGRVVFGRGGGAIGPAGRVLARHHHDPRAVAEVIADFRRWFPELADVRITHSWGGAVDRAPGHLPFVGALDREERVLYGLGYSGNGVGPSALVGRILALRALGSDDPDAASPLFSGPPGYLPPEPLRTLGGILVRAAVKRAEEAEEAGERAGPPGRLRGLVSARTPAWLEPRLRLRR
jgi:glycine/D-amino acid oxidase-like deaminating enzyme